MQQRGSCSSCGSYGAGCNKITRTRALANKFPTKSAQRSDYSNPNHQPQRYTLLGRRTHRTKSDRSTGELSVYINLFYIAQLIILNKTQSSPTIFGREIRTECSSSGVYLCIRTSTTHWPDKQAIESVIIGITWAKDVAEKGNVQVHRAVHTPQLSLRDMLRVSLYTYIRMLWGKTSRPYCNNIYVELSTYTYRQHVFS